MTALTRLLVAALVTAAAGPANAAEPQKPEPGTAWAKVTYEVGDEGDAESCKVLETNFADKEMGQNVCATILAKWKFGKKTYGQTVTQYVVLKGGKN